MSPDGASTAIHVNRSALTVLTTVAMLIGIFPYVLTVGHPELLIYFAIGSLIISILSIRSFKTLATEVPEPFEFLLGGVSAILGPAVAGFLGFCTWSLFTGGAKLAAYLLAWQIEPAPIAFYGSLIVTIFFAFGTALIGAKNLAQQLYPQTAGIKSVFYSFSTQRRGQLLAGIAVAVSSLLVSVLVVVLTGATFNAWWFNLWLLLSLILVSAPFSNRRGETPTKETGSAVNAVQKLLEASRYEVVPSPRTGQDEIDPLLVNLDLYASRGEHALAVKVLTASEAPERTDWPAMSDLSTASWALTDFFQEDSEGRSPNVVPLIVVVGQVLPELFQAYLSKNDVHIAEIKEPHVIDEILRSTDQEQLRAMAERYLDIPDMGQRDTPREDATPRGRDVPC